MTHPPASYCDDISDLLESSQICFFDCDGVVFDSNGFKIQAMLKVLEDYPEAAQASMRRFWRNNGGMSRHAKFRHFFESIAREGRSDAEVTAAVDAAVAQFGVYSLAGYLEVEPVPQALALARHVGRERAVIVSGAAQAELREVFELKRISGLFSEVLGSPVKKLDLVARVLEQRQVAPERALLIGDGARDFEVCAKLGMHFVYLDCYSEWEGAKRALSAAPNTCWAADWPTLLKMFGL